MSSGSRILKFTAVGSFAAVLAYYLSDNRSSFHKLTVLGLGLLEPESSHRLAIWAASKGLLPKQFHPDPPQLAQKIWDMSFSNPIGLAAGFDKDGQGIDALLGLGFGFVEIGSVTPLPQEGNARPRVFRLPEDGAIINRYGFNSQGMLSVADRLHSRFISGKPVKGILGINVGKNKTSPNAELDYSVVIKELKPYADYLVVNVSSPNTAGLRDLQAKESLGSLLDSCLKARDEPGPTYNSTKKRPPLLVKIAPDLSFAEENDIACILKTRSIDGIIISNTTVSRPDDLKSINKVENGGLSGKPLLEKSTQQIRRFYQLTQGKIPIIGVGGISSGKDAYEKIKQGASLIQLYTGLIYGGSCLIPEIKKELLNLLEKDGYKNISEAIGKDNSIIQN